MYAVQSPEDQERIAYLMKEKTKNEQKAAIIRKELLSLIYKIEKK